MKTYKYLLLGLFILIGLSVLFITPSRSNFEVFASHLVKTATSTKWFDHFLFFLKYPPGVVTLWSWLLHHFSLDPKEFIYFQPIWKIHKIVLYLAYFLTGIGVVKFAGLYSKKQKKPVLDTILIYLFSIPILHLGISLAYFEILAIPLFVFSLLFFFKQRHFLFALFYLLAIFFDWTLFFYLPLILIYRGKKTAIAKILAICLPPVSALLLLVSRGGMTKLVDFASETINIFPAALDFRLTGVHVFVFLTFFTTIQLLIFSRAKKLGRLSVTKLLYLFLAQAFNLLLFLPYVSEGKIIWLVVFGLLAFISSPTKEFRHLWVTINVFVFFTVYLFLGVSGSAPVKGDFFEIVRQGASCMFILFGLLYIAHNLFTKRLIDLTRLKLLTIIFLVLVNIGHFPALGDPDTISWAIYAKGVIKYADPFLAHVKVNQFYAPLSTIIIGFFALLWKNIVGVSHDYLLATKIGIFFFSLLTIVIFFKRSLFKSIKTMTSLDKIFVIATCFSLSLQTFGMADINIFLIPPLFMAVIYLYRRAYFKSGLFFALSASVKWQPLALLPLFGVAVFNFDKPFKRAVGDSLLFLLGFLPFVVGLWWLVIIQPDGAEQFRKTFQLYTTGGVYLSGQAMNLNWIVTYLLHVFWPHVDYPLSVLHGLNRQVYPGAFPHIFRGFFFQLVTGIIVFRFWLFQQKNILTFLEACVAILFSHHILNSSAMELHLFYPVIFMLFLYFLKPNPQNGSMLNLFNIMSIVNIMMFYGFTGDKWFNRLFLGFDITVAYAVYYLIIYFWFMKNYFFGWKAINWKVFPNKA